MAVERSVSYEDRVIAMREAIDELAAAVNVVRITTLRLVNADLQGAVDVVSHVLYQMHKASDTLESQYKLLSSVDPEQGRTQSDANLDEGRDAAPSSGLARIWSRRGAD